MDIFINPMKKTFLNKADNTTEQFFLLNYVPVNLKVAGQL